MFNLTPEMLQKGLLAMGIAAGNLKLIEPETKQVVARFFMAAVASGNVNEFVRTKLEAALAPPPPQTVTAQARVVARGEFDDDKPPRRRR